IHAAAAGHGPVVACQTAIDCQTRWQSFVAGRSALSAIPAILPAHPPVLQELSVPWTSTPSRPWQPPGNRSLGTKAQCRPRDSARSRAGHLLWALAWQAHQPAATENPGPLPMVGLAKPDL